MQSISPQERPAPRWLAGALIGLCTAQPLLDVLSFWTQTLGRATSVSLALRMLLLAAAAVLAFVLSERKRAYLILCWRSFGVRMCWPAAAWATPHPCPI